MEDTLRVGVISSTHGVRGEVKVYPTTDDVNRFKKLKTVILDTGREQMTLSIESVKFFKNMVILKFKEFNNINEIEKYKGKDLLIRRVNVTACNLVSETEIPEDKPEQLDMFTDYEALEQEKKARQLAEEKERRLQNVTLAIQDRYGKNAMLKGMNLMEGGTTIARNGQIGGHKAGEE